MIKKIIVGTILGTALFSQTAFAANYTVKAGDTLWKIATSNGVTVDQVVTWNNLKSNTIYTGQVLTLSQNSTSVSPTESVSTYTVQVGDTLWKIATSNGLTVDQVKTLNSLTSTTVYVGQVLKLKATTTSNPTPTPSTPPTSSATYTVKAGDYFSLIARNVGMTVSQLLALNPQVTDVNLIKVGQVLTISSGSTTNNWETIADNVIKSGEKYLGVRYLYGASTSRTDAFDCSSFTWRAFSENGISLPRTTYDQVKMGTTIPLSQARKGDLVFFDTDYDGSLNHVGIYLGNGKMINASTSAGVSYATFNSYWQPRFVKAIRIIN
jgi:LysM repeat protein